MGHRLKIGIVGAGIGGITAAVAMQQRGLNVVVYEQSPALGEIGAGITVGPNANKVVNGLGLEDEFEALSSASPHVGTLDNKTGERLSYEIRGKENFLKMYGSVSRLMHRADVHAALERAFNTNDDALKLNHKLTEIEQNDDGVTLRFANGVTDRCDVAVACDGLKSMVRDTLFETEPPKFTGFLAWRGLVPRSKVPNVSLDPHFAAFTAEDKMFGRYPVRHGTLINYVANARRPGFTSESWKETADIAEVLEEFEGWHEDVVSIIRATPGARANRWALHSREPLDTWVSGRVCLLGDAAHPMTPFYGMGAGMAMEDAAVLARCLEASGDDWEGALQRYERARIGRANKFHRGSLERGKTYMSADPAARSKTPNAGMEDEMSYDAMSVPI
ncbi:MAG: NAD(P)-binding protein [Rhodospirillaceae bacterium]|nr:NAD(P)-binding protein [Rhodospirillaceae bacterium]MBT5240148.1 NAD(P)-binding protein [Rhodospirillaceae bacterium]MBT5566927.1 NAD(P)-binding protein [Rhodospirillaceae bacterium]MBT6090386.1 NAD(P)-binding protein [Rhodospirillaceae bacterium]MBT7449295.1 NAD(P)-binding protein [Rhodospirillaceae bacterium]